jgi:hypothetical protein
MTESRWVIVALCLAAAPAGAQSIESVSVFKVRLFRQTDAATASLLDPGDLPYRFDAAIEGEDMDLLNPAPSVTGPFSNPEPGHNGGVLGLDDDEWRYGFPFFEGWGAETQGALDSLFGEGTYSFTIGGQTAEVALGPAVYPASAPRMTLSGGAWDNGVYRVDAGSEITISSGAFAEFGVAGVETAVFLRLAGDDFGAEVEAFGSDGGTGVLGLVIPAGALTPGGVYLVEALHSIATDLRPLAFGGPDAIAAGGHENATEVVVLVNDAPWCPADLAEPFGVLDLSDIVAFVGAFTMMDPIADFDGNGLFDLSDITAFVSSFVAGCP